MWRQSTVFCENDDNKTRKYKNDVQSFVDIVEATKEGPFPIFRETSPQNWRDGHYSGPGCCAEPLELYKNVFSVHSNFYNIVAHKVLNKSAIPVLKVWWPTIFLNGTDGALARCTPNFLPKPKYECKADCRTFGTNRCYSVDGTHYWGPGPAYRLWNKLLHNLVLQSDIPGRTTSSNSDWRKISSLRQFK